MQLTPAAIAGEPEGTAKPATAPSTQPGDTVIPLSRWGNLYLVKAAINFQKVGYLVVDTGATTTIIDRELADHLKLPVLGSSEINQVSGKAKVNLVRVSELQVGDFSQINTVVTSSDAVKSLHFGVPVAGTLGLEFLGLQPFTLDCRHDLLILHRPDSFVPPPADTSKSFVLDTTANTGFAVQGKIDGCPGWFDIDSGDEGGVEIYQPFLVLNRLNMPKHQYRSDGFGMTLGAQLEQDLNWYSSFEVFDRKHTGVWATFEPKASATDSWRIFAGRIGMGEMTDGIFTFDPAHRRLWVQWPPRETTDEMLKRLGDPHGTDLKGMTPLMRAARAGRADVVQQLLKAGADPSAMRPVYTIPALAEAITSEQPDVVQALLAGGAPVDQAINSHHVTPLQYAAKRGNLKVVEVLLKAGASVTAADDEGRTPLLLSVWSNHLEVAKALIAAHAPVDAKDHYGFFPLIYASSAGDPRIVEALIAAGAKVDEPTNSGETSLGAAVDSSQLRVAKFLLDHGASVNAQSRDGVTPLLLAASHEDADVIRLLLDHGADVSQKDSTGRSAIDYAVNHGRGVIVKMLLDHLDAAAPKGAHAQNNDPAPSLDKLFAMAPDLRSEDQKIKTLHVTGHYFPYAVIQFSFELSYQRTGKGLVAIFDRSDDTPISIWQNGKWLRYFPLERKVVVMDDGDQAAFFRFFADPQEHEVNFNYNFKKDPALGTAMTFDVDLKSLIDPNAATWSPQSLKGGIVELRGTSPRGSLVTARFDPSRQWPFENLSIFPAGSKESAVAISNVTVNQKLPPDPFKFPSKAAASAQVPVVDVEHDAETDKAISKYGALEWFYRSALRHAELRPFVQQKLARTIDWDAELKLEEQTSAAVRQLTKDAGFPTGDAQKW